MMKMLKRYVTVMLLAGAAAVPCFAAETSYPARPVPFAPAPAVAAVVGNQVQIGCTALPPTTPHAVVNGSQRRFLAADSS